MPKYNFVILIDDILYLGNRKVKLPCQRLVAYSVNEPSLHYLAIALGMDILIDQPFYIRVSNILKIHRLRLLVPLEFPFL